MGNSSGGAGPDNSLQLEQMKQDQAARDKAAFDAQTASDTAKKQADFASALTNAKSSALDRANLSVTEAGLDPTQFGDLFTRAINDKAALVPQLDGNPGGYFGDDFVNNVLTNYQQGQRMAKAREVQNTFTPGFANNLISSNADDPYISDILNSQRTAAQQVIDRAHARGNLDDTGYATAQSKLGNMYAQGNATAHTLGSAVIDNYRGKLSSIGDNALSNANSFNLGNTFDINTYTKQRDDQAAAYNSQLEGGVRNALAGQNFFDVGSLIAQAGTAQGPVNPRLSAPGIIAQRNQLRDSNRGLGTEGTF